MTNTSSSRICILDAGPLIHLDQIGELRLVLNMGKIFVPETVAWEAEQHRPGIRAMLGDCVVNDVIEQSPNLSTALMDRPLHTGEVAALAWAEKFGADLFVSDDDDARAVAKLLGYRSTGTLGVIRDAFRRGEIALDGAKDMLRAVGTRSTLHIKPSLLAEVIASLG